MKSSADAAEHTLPVADTVAPPIVPGEPVIDRDHLARMTLGERALENEILALFDMQASLLLARMAGEAPGAVAALAHTLKGSACGIGAWRVAEAAEKVERAAGEPAANGLPGAVKALTAAVAEARMAIVGLLRSH
jgi:HPt (histidine-containing phosphotransfer) domain-containing protein